MAKTAFRQRDVQAAIKAAQACGYVGAAVEIRPDGSILLLTMPPAPVAPLADEEDSDSFLDRWNARKKHP